MSKFQVAVIGSGNWGTGISKVCAQNTLKLGDVFHSSVKMWVFSEPARNNPSILLHDYINTHHENINYLPGIKLPDNLVAVDSIVEACGDADLLVFVVPHQFLRGICNQLKGKLKPTALGITLIKGLEANNGELKCLSAVIHEVLGLKMCALSGANVANDIAREEFTETTIGYSPGCLEDAKIWKNLINTDYFLVSIVEDLEGVQLLGAIKNVVAVTAGFIDALGLGTNAKSAIIRIGAEEIRLFCAAFFPKTNSHTFFESAGYADLITTCFGGRNVRCAKEFASRRIAGKNDSWDIVENDLLNGMKMQGQLACAEVYEVLKKYELVKYFPLIDVTHKIAFEDYPVQGLIKYLSNAHGMSDPFEVVESIVNKKRSIVDL